MPHVTESEVSGKVSFNNEIYNGIDPYGYEWVQTNPMNDNSSKSVNPNNSNNTNNLNNQMIVKDYSPNNQISGFSSDNAINKLIKKIDMLLIFIIFILFILIINMFINISKMNMIGINEKINALLKSTQH